MQKTISIIVPVFNEEKNVPLIAHEITRVFNTLPSYTYELIFVNDGSSDNSLSAINALAETDAKIKLIDFSRNFGKESATSAGLHASTGDAVMIIDADLQHPPELIPQFIKKWEEGAEIVIGVRSKNKKAGIVKNFGSKLFIAIMEAMSDTELVACATDFRLIDRMVVDEFNKLTERNRMTRGLFEWLGFKRDFVYFEAEERANGKASYSVSKLVKLALSSFVAHSLFPLKFAGYLGVFITLSSGILGVVVFVQRYVMADVFGWNVSGTAQLAILNVFLIGLVLSCLGLIALYIGNIHDEVAGRPLYVVRNKRK